MRNLASLIVLLCSFAGSAFGWGCDGHQIVAFIARAHLTPNASAAVDQLLRDNPIDPSLRRFCREKPTDLMADSATWADDSREGDKTNAWHYIDIPLPVEGGDAMKWCPPLTPMVEGKDRTGCILNALGEQLGILRDSRQPGPVRARALRYVIHFVGDMNQPLHDEDNGDQGGNCASIQFFSEARPTNLHSIWDTRIIQSDMAAKHDTPVTYAAELDQRFAKDWPKWGEVKPDFTAWVWDGHKLARSVAYGNLSPGIPAATVPPPSCDDERQKVAALHIVVGQAYYDAALPVIDGQLAKAGYGLAGLLNQTFQ